MAEYVVSAVDATEPNDDRPASYLGIEMRTLKAHNNTVNQAQGETNTSVAEDLAAIEALFNTTTGVAGLPAGKGVLNVLLALYKEVFGYTEGESVFPSLAAKIAALDTSLNNTLTGALGTLTNTVNQHTTSINSLTNTQQQQAIKLTNHDNWLNGYGTRINNLELAVNNLANSPSTRLPVGFVLMSTNAANPATYLGYGSWIPTNQGRIPVGVGNNIAGTGYNIGQAEVNYGERTINIAKGNLPPHTHTYSKPVIGNSNNGGSGGYLWEVSGVTNAETGNITGNPATGQAPAPLPIYPPMVGYYFWKRVS